MVKRFSVIGLLLPLPANRTSFVLNRFTVRDNAPNNRTEQQQ
jgi:hypothetical protein